ncbi:MAG: MazG family protein [Chloroflexi bacterium]|nr:MazG family protein [Chloroflexota bacterium]
MSIGVSVEALAEAAGIALREGLQVGAISVLAPDPAHPALLLIDAPIAPSRLRRYPLDTEVQVIVEKNGSLRTETLDIQALLAAASLPPHARALVLPRVAPEAVRHDLAGLRGVIARLRDPECGCPWDLDQDHRSLRPHLLEETYEVLQALDRDDPRALREELGDLMMQVFLHAQIAEGDGQFDIDDVAEGIRAKLIRRHPHVFGAAQAADANAVVENWDRLKAEERTAGNAEASALDGVPQAQPALARAQSLVGRAARQGFAPSDDPPSGVMATPPNDAASWGDLLFLLARLAQREGIQLEDALREAADRFEARFRALEAALRTEGVAPSELTAAELAERWTRTACAHP